MIYKYSNSALCKYCGDGFCFDGCLDEIYKPLGVRFTTHQLKCISQQSNDAITHFKLAHTS